MWLSSYATANSFGSCQLKGYIEADVIDATFSVMFPLLPEITLAHVHGDLNKGVEVTFSIGSIVSGTARFYLKDKWLWLDLSAKVWGQPFGPVSIRLIPYPLCVFLCCSTTYGFCCRALRIVH
jgi:hypothetical protein